MSQWESTPAVRTHPSFDVHHMSPVVALTERHMGETRWFNRRHFRLHSSRSCRLPLKSLILARCVNVIKATKAGNTFPIVFPCCTKSSLIFLFNKYDVLRGFRSDGLAHETAGKRAVVNLAAHIARGCDSAVGGTLPQLGVESPVSAETEGEFGRERDPGCTSENGVSIIGLYFPGSGWKRRLSSEGILVPGCPTLHGESLLPGGFNFFFSLSRAFTLINEGQAPVAECLWLEVGLASCLANVICWIRSVIGRLAAP